MEAPREDGTCSLNEAAGRAGSGDQEQPCLMSSYVPNTPPGPQIPVGEMVLASWCQQVSEGGR